MVYRPSVEFGDCMGVLEEFAAGSATPAAEEAGVSGKRPREAFDPDA